MIRSCEWNNDWETKEKCNNVVPSQALTLSFLRLVSSYHSEEIVEDADKETPPNKRQNTMQDTASLKWLEGLFKAALWRHCDEGAIESFRKEFPFLLALRDRSFVDWGVRMLTPPEICEAVVRNRDLPIMEKAVADGCRSALTLYMSKFCETAASRGERELLQWAKQHDFQFTSMVFTWAAHRVDIDMLLWVLQNDCPWKEDALINRMNISGNLKQLALLLFSFKEVFTRNCEKLLLRFRNSQDACYWYNVVRLLNEIPDDEERVKVIASLERFIVSLHMERELVSLRTQLAMSPLRKGNKDAVQWLCNGPWSCQVQVQAVAERNKGIIEWMIDNGCYLISSAAVTQAVCQRDMDMLQWLREKGFAWDSTIFNAAVEARSWEIMLQWPRDNGCPTDTSACAAAARQGNMDMLCWLKEIGCHMDGHALAAAADRYRRWEGEETMMKWLIEQGCPLQTAACAAAAERRNLSLLKWLIDRSVRTDVESEEEWQMVTAYIERNEEALKQCRILWRSTELKEWELVKLLMGKRCSLAGSGRMAAQKGEWEMVKQLFALQGESYRTLQGVRELCEEAAKQENWVMFKWLQDQGCQFSNTRMIKKAKNKQLPAMTINPRFEFEEWMLRDYSQPSREAPVTTETASDQGGEGEKYGTQQKETKQQEQSKDEGSINEEEEDMKKVETLLERWKMGKYSEAFREEAIGMKALKLLSNEDLKELGVKLGHRKVLIPLIKEGKRFIPFLFFV